MRWKLGCLILSLSAVVQGVIEYSLALFFNKLVSYTFLFWLPYYVKKSREFLPHYLCVCLFELCMHANKRKFRADSEFVCIYNSLCSRNKYCVLSIYFFRAHINIKTVTILWPDPEFSSEQSDWLSTLFDVGGIIGETRSCSLSQVRCVRFDELSVLQVVLQLVFCQISSMPELCPALSVLSLQCRV